VFGASAGAADPGGVADTAARAGGVPEAEQLAVRGRCARLAGAGKAITRRVNLGTRSVTPPMRAAGGGWRVATDGAGTPVRLGEASRILRAIFMLSA
jgi:hypothetical protein